MVGSWVFETQLDEICLFPLQNKKNSFTFDDKKADEVKNFGRAEVSGRNRRLPLQSRVEGVIRKVDHRLRL